MSEVPLFIFRHRQCTGGARTSCPSSVQTRQSNRWFDLTSGSI